MAPTRPRQRPAERPTSESDEDLESNSQEVKQLESVKGTIAQMKKRRDKKRNALIGEYEKYVKETRSKIEKAAAIRKTKVDQAHAHLWNRLDALNTKREKLEHAILKSMKIIELANRNMSQQIDAMYDGRIEDLKEIVLHDIPELVLDGFGAGEFEAFDLGESVRLMIGEDEETTLVENA